MALLCFKVYCELVKLERPFCFSWNAATLEAIQSNYFKVGSSSHFSFVNVFINLFCLRVSFVILKKNTT